MFVVIHIRLPRLKLRTSDARFILCTNSRHCVTIKSHAVTLLSPPVSMSVEGLSSVSSQELQETIVSNHEQSTNTFLSAHSLSSKKFKDMCSFSILFLFLEEDGERGRELSGWGCLHIFSRHLMIFLSKCHRFITFTSSTEP